MRPSSRIKDLAFALCEWRPQDPSALTWLLPELRELLGAAFVGVYQPMVAESGWGLEFMRGAGQTAPSHVRAFHAFVACLPPTDHFLGYNPYHVDFEERGRALHLRDLAPLNIKAFGDVLHAVGVSNQDQLRVLACDGPRLLSWVGATRTEPFTRRDVGILQYLTGPIQRRLRLERQLQPAWPSSLAMEVALEALGRPAFVIGPRGSVEVANRAGMALCERNARDVLVAIRRSETVAASRQFTITKIAAAGYPPYVLAVQERQPDLATRLSLAQRTWGLTARQTRVLELMTTGASNKEIASQLSCARVTVENHITQLYRRSGARSRADLVARLFVMVS